MSWMPFGSTETVSHCFRRCCYLFFFTIIWIFAIINESCLVLLVSLDFIFCLGAIPFHAVQNVPLFSVCIWKILELSFSTVNNWISKGFSSHFKPFLVLKISWMLESLVFSSIWISTDTFSQAFEWHNLRLSIKYI